MSAAKYDLKVEQGSTLQFLMEFVKDGTSLNLVDYEFKGEVKASIYDDAGYPLRFEKQDAFSVMVYLDASVSSTFDFEEGVYDIVMISSDGRIFRLLKGDVAIDLGVTI